MDIRFNRIVENVISNVITIGIGIYALTFLKIEHERNVHWGGKSVTNYVASLRKV